MSFPRYFAWPPAASDCCLNGGGIRWLTHIATKTGWSKNPGNYQGPHLDIIWQINPLFPLWVMQNHSIFGVLPMQNDLPTILRSHLSCFKNNTLKGNTSKLKDVNPQDSVPSPLPGLKLSSHIAGATTTWPFRTQKWSRWSSEEVRLAIWRESRKDFWLTQALKHGFRLSLLQPQRATWKIKGDQHKWRVFSVTTVRNYFFNSDLNQ